MAHANDNDKNNFNEITSNWSNYVIKRYKREL